MFATNHRPLPMWCWCRLGIVLAAPQAGLWWWEREVEIVGVVVVVGGVVVMVVAMRMKLWWYRICIK